MINDVEQAIQRAHQHILETQQPDGSWHAAIDTGPALTAQGLVALVYLHALDEETEKSCLRWIRWQQLEDGAFPAETGGHTADPISTALCLAAFTACGQPEYERPAAGARSYLDAHGGVAASIAARSLRTSTAAVYLSIAGLLDPAAIPGVPILAALLPAAGRFFETRIHPSVLLALFQLDAVRDALMGGLGLEDVQWSRRLLSEHLVADQTSRQNPAGHWNGSAGETMAALIAFRAVGLPVEDDRIRRGLDWLADQVVDDVRGAWFRETDLAVPATALAVQALATGPVSGSMTAITAGLEWLAAVKAPAGWGEQPGNMKRPKSTAAGAALAAFGCGMQRGLRENLPPDTIERLLHVTVEASGLLRSMQNADSGWPFEFRGMPPVASVSSGNAGIELPETVPGWWRFLREPPPAAGDPSSPAASAEVMRGLALAGYGSRTSTMRSGSVFLQKFQAENGSWNDSPAHTALALQAAGALNFSAGNDWVRRAGDYLAETQLLDGGWPEEADGRCDPGESGAPWLTGLISAALVAVGFRNSLAVNRGVLFLLQNQLPTGGWLPSHGVNRWAVLPDWRFSAVDSACYASIALSKYLNAVAG